MQSESTSWNIVTCYFGGCNRLQHIYIYTIYNNSIDCHHSVILHHQKDGAVGLLWVLQSGFIFFGSAEQIEQWELHQVMIMLVHPSISTPKSTQMVHTVYRCISYVLLGSWTSFQNRTWRHNGPKSFATQMNAQKWAHLCCVHFGPPFIPLVSSPSGHHLQIAKQQGKWLQSLSRCTGEGIDPEVPNLWRLGMRLVRGNVDCRDHDITRKVVMTN